MLTTSWWSVLKTMRFRAFQITQRTVMLAVWVVVLGEQGSAQSASAVCLTVVGGACPDNRRAHSCSKRGHI
jgi:hypothetical protein